MDILDLFNFKDFTILFSGFVLTLSVYHFLLYFQHKDRVYLYYSLYTFLVFTSSYPNIESSFLSGAILNPDPYLHFLIIPREWIYNTMYLIFAKALVELKVFKPKIDRFVNIGVITLLIILALTMIIAYITGRTTLVGIIYAYLFTSVIGILSLISLYALYTMDTGLKYYVLIGSFVYLILAEGAFYFTDDEQQATVIFYTGIIIEMILFSLALGYKQKMILQEKNDSQQKLILQLQENEKLRFTVQNQLQKDVELLNEQAKFDKLEQAKVKSDKELLELKISSLQSQMNPHFIFNSLNAIKLYIIDNEKENAVYYLNKFSKLIRKILASAREKENTLAEEIETLKLYLEIENIRFHNEIESSFFIDKKLNLNTLKIPTLILQPFIENSIWHGLSSKKGSKKINILFEKEANSFLKITIDDNGVGRKKSSEIKNNKIHRKESIGIKLTEERLSNFTKDLQSNYTLEYIDLYDVNNNAKGTKVLLKIPLY